MTFDRLPRRKELVFERVHKTLYLQLTTVIRSLASKWLAGGQGEARMVYATIENLASTVGYSDTLSRAKQPYILHCVLAEIRGVTYFYQLFFIGENGGLANTKKLRTGIERLEFLRDNWNDLEVVGDLKNGYHLRVKE